MLYVILAAALVLLDQVVKFLVRSHIELGGHVPFIPHVLELTYVQNTGAAFSMLEEHTWILTALSVVLIAAMVVALWKKVLTHPIGITLLVVIIAGGIGNLIDRVAFGFVTDMFSTLFMDFAVFNVADICITCGGFLLVFYVLFLYDKLEKKEESKDVDGTDLPADPQ